MSSALHRDYVVSQELGRGRFGTVFRCTSVSTGASYAIKSVDKLAVTSAGDALDSRCLLTEPKILNLLSPHPNIVSLHALYEDQAHLHMVLDLCHHKPELHTLIRPTPEPESASIMIQLMRSVAHCHRLGVAHRDIKPENIMFGEGNRVKLVDLGAGEVFREEELMSGVVGTPHYVAPEVVAGGEYCEKVDVWSCGVVLYELLAGFLPFRGDSPVEVFEAVVRANLRFPSRVFRTVSPEAKDLIRRMLCKDVSRRFSAEQVLSKCVKIMQVLVFLWVGACFVQLVIL